MRSTPEVGNIDSKRMRVDVMTKKGEVRFAKECKRLLDLCDEIGTKGNTKHAKKQICSTLKSQILLGKQRMRHTFQRYAGCPQDYE